MSDVATPVQQQPLRLDKQGKRLEQLLVENTRLCTENDGFRTQVDGHRAQIDELRTSRILVARLQIKRVSDSFIILVTAS